MELTESQKHTIASWIAAGATLSEIQKRLNSEFQITATYMEVRFLVDDLNLAIQDKAPPPPPSPANPATPDAPLPPPQPEAALDADAELLPPESEVQVEVDMVQRPGALISGHVLFSDQTKAQWYIDQMGRLGIVPPKEGYRPSEKDLQAFQAALQKELAKHGF